MNEAQKAWLELMKTIIREAESAGTEEAYAEAVDKMNSQIEAAP